MPVVKTGTWPALSLPAINSYGDVDVTSLVGSDAGNVAGVMIYVRNTHASTAYKSHVRKKGSSYDASGMNIDIRPGSGSGGHAPFFIGVDSNNLLQMYRNNTAITAYLAAYFINEEAYFFDTEYQGPTNDSYAWYDHDITSLVQSGDTAVMAFGRCYKFSVGNYAYQLRPNGSSRSSVYRMDELSHTGFCCPLDADEIYEVFYPYRTRYLVTGYLKSTANYEFLTYSDVSATSSSAWQTRTGWGGTGTMSVVDQWSGGTGRLSVREPSQTWPTTGVPVSSGGNWWLVPNNSSSQFQVFEDVIGNMSSYYWGGMGAYIPPPAAASGKDTPFKKPFDTPSPIGTF